MRKNVLSKAAICLAAISISTVSAADEYGAVAIIVKPGGDEWQSPMGYSISHYGYGHVTYTTTPYEKHRARLGNYAQQLKVSFPDLFSSVLLDVSFSQQPDVKDINSSPTWSSLRGPTILSVPGNFPYDTFQLTASGAGNDYGIWLNWTAYSEGDTGIYGQGTVTFTGTNLNSYSGMVRLTTDVHELPLTGNVKPIVGNVNISGGSSFSASSGARSFTVGTEFSSSSGGGGLTLTFDTESQLQAITLTGKINVFGDFVDGILEDIPVSVRVDIPLGAMPTVDLGTTLEGSGISISGSTANGGSVTVTVDPEIFVWWLRTKGGIY